MKPVNERAVLKINRDLLVKIWAILALVGLSSTARAQQPDAPAPQPDAVIASPAPVQVARSSQAAQTSAQGVPPVVLTLQDALSRARGNNVMFQTAVTDANVTKQDRYQAAAGMLPPVTYINQGVYSQRYGLRPNKPPLFIANNGPPEYVSQADIHEVFDLAALSNFRKTM